MPTQPILIQHPGSIVIIVLHVRAVLCVATPHHPHAGSRCRKELASPLWGRARQAGAYSDTERRNFGIADDIYAAGLLLAYMAFIPFCEPRSIDGPSLQRSAYPLLHASPHSGLLLTAPEQQVLLYTRYT